MELSDAIKSRRSIRKYKEVEIPNDIIEDLIESARLAPSAKMNDERLNASAVERTIVLFFIFSS